MSGSGDGSHNNFLGYCDTFNPYFIGTSAASIVLVLINMYLSYRRDKSVTRGSIDWGLPWGIGLFLFNIGLWNLAPSNVFFLIFKDGLPASFPLGERMACLAVQNFPIITIFLIWTGLHLLLLYNGSGMVYSVRKFHCDDTDLLAKDDWNSDARKSDANRQVLMVGLAARGRFLLGRCEARKKWLNREKNDDGSTPSYVARTVALQLHSTIARANLDFVENNLDLSGVKSDEYTVCVGKPLSRENLFGIPLQDNSVDKVILGNFVRGAPPIGTFSTNEKLKAERMAMLLAECLRVLKPGGKIMAVDNPGNALPLYADLRDLLGEKNVTLEEDAGKLPVTYFMSFKAMTVTATKPSDYDDPDSEVRQEAAARSSQRFSVQVDERDESSPLLPANDSIAIEDVRNSLPEWKKMATMLPLQVFIFLALCFIAAALYKPLDLPTTIPIGERFGNQLINVATSYPSMAFFEREIVLGSTAFTSCGHLLRHQLRTTSVALIVTLLFTFIYGMPTFFLQIGLHQTGLSDTVKSIIGIAISLIIGIVAYKYGTYARNKAMLKERDLDLKYMKHL